MAERTKKEEAAADRGLCVGYLELGRATQCIVHHLSGDSFQYQPDQAMRLATFITLCFLTACDSQTAGYAGHSTPNDAERIIAACATTMGGVEALENLRTFRTTASWDGEDPVVTDVQRPNLFRTAGRASMVFDGERAAMLSGPEEDGEPGGPELLDAEVWKDFEVDLAFNFPAFFDYPTEYLGVDSLEGTPVHQLLVTLPLETRITYLIDANTHLPLAARTVVTIDGTEYTPERLYLEFKEVDGILLPSRFKQGWTPETAQTGVLLEAEMNVNFGEDHFRLPAVLLENR